MLLQEGLHGGAPRASRSRRDSIRLGPQSRRWHRDRRGLADARTRGRPLRSIRITRSRSHPEAAHARGTTGHAGRGHGAPPHAPGSTGPSAGCASSEPARAGPGSGARPPGSVGRSGSATLSARGCVRLRAHRRGQSSCRRPPGSAASLDGGDEAQSAPSPPL